MGASLVVGGKAEKRKSASTPCSARCHPSRKRSQATEKRRRTTRVHGRQSFKLVIWSRPHTRLYEESSASHSRRHFSLARRLGLDSEVNDGRQQWPHAWHCDRPRRQDL